jgi:enterochelin esterase-like enzyme
MSHTLFPRMVVGSFISAIIILTLLAGCQKALQNQNYGSTPTTVSNLRDDPTSVPTLLPSPTITSTPLPCKEEKGKVVDQVVPTKLLSLPVKLKIYLPPCYNSDLQANYPVLYMLHGQTYTNDQWIRLGLTATADSMIASKSIQPFLIVMPYEISWTASPDVSKYGEALIQEVIPYIDANFRVCKNRSCRAIGGLSRGGNWAVNLGFGHPQLFTAIGAHSTPLFFGEIIRINTNVKAMKSPDDAPAIYLDVGNKDENKKQVLMFVDILKKINVAYLFTEFLGYHQESYWAAHVQNYLLWYSGQFSPVP